MNEGFFLRVRAGRPLVTVADPADLAEAAERHDALLEGTPEGVWAEVRGTGPTRLRWWVGGPVPFGERAWRSLECTTGAREPAAVLGCLGAQGLTRVAVSSADPFAEALKRAGLVDRS